MFNGDTSHGFNPRSSGRYQEIRRSHQTRTITHRERYMCAYIYTHVYMYIYIYIYICIYRYQSRILMHTEGYPNNSCLSSRISGKVLVFRFKVSGRAKTYTCNSSSGTPTYLILGYAGPFLEYCHMGHGTALMISASLSMSCTATAHRDRFAVWTDLGSAMRKSSATERCWCIRKFSWAMMYYILL